MTDSTNTARPAGRQPWNDRWLLDAFRQMGHPGAVTIQPAASAWEALEQGGVTRAEILAVASDLSGLRPADLTLTGPEQAELLPQALATRYDVIPVALRGRDLEVATANPLGQNLERDLSFAIARQVIVAIASPQEIRAAAERIYGHAHTPGTGRRLQWSAGDERAGVTAAPVRGAAVELVDRVLVDAMDQRASDIHFEPKDSELLVRFRVDGVLHDAARLAGDIAPLVIARLKVLAGLDIADRMRPQDGRASARLDDGTVDLRVSSLPLGNRGEKVVVRVLDARAAQTDLSALGFTPGEGHRLNQLLAATEGMLLVTGPTGSGKTTTLYSVLRQLQSAETNIVTVEDPIEYRLDGVNQVQVNEKTGLTFASALRSILRQDPDAVLVGEIRDAETASIAVKASMTGHLVLSTLHTNSAPETVSRLLDIGADPGALSGALKGIVAQRLVRRLCSVCSEPLALDALPTEQQMLLSGHRTDRLRKAVGCPACRGTGYRGRMVVAEVLVVTPQLQQAVARTASVSELTDLARQGGMHSLWESGVERVVAGTTSLHELLDNVAAPVVDEAPAQAQIDDLVASLLRAQTSGGGAGATSGASDVGDAPRTVASPPMAASPHAAATGPRALVVHDVREHRAALRAALHHAGWGVIEAADGEAALAYARRLRPDVVVCELALPRLDGVGLMQALAAEERPPRLVVYTEQRDAELMRWVRELGASDVVEAPIDLPMLVARLRALVESAAA